MRYQSVRLRTSIEKINLHILVSIPTLIKQEIVNKTALGTSMKPYVTRQALGKVIF
jgi:hypothetical protein